MNIRKKFFLRFLLVILAAISVAAIVVSCNKLDLTPLDKTTTSTFFNKKSDFEGGLFAAYSSMQDLYAVNSATSFGGHNGAASFWVTSMLASDDAQFNTSQNNSDVEVMDVDALNLKPNNRFIYTVYAETYEGINRANIVLEQVDNGRNNLTDEEKKVVVAEAKFIRGFFHFLAAQMWKTAPLITETAKKLQQTFKNSDPTALLQASLDDFKAAAIDLPTSWDAAFTGRATKWTARAYEGKVDVWMGKWDDAVVAFEDVEKNAGYQLLPQYDDNFAVTNENNNESIFEIQFGGPYSDDNSWILDDNGNEDFKSTQGTSRQSFFIALTDAGANRWFVPTRKLKDLFDEEPADKRLDESLYYKEGEDYTVYETGSNVMKSGVFTTALTGPTSLSPTGLAIKKYLGKKNADPAYYRQGVSFNNERFFRYSELLLLHAEALLSGGKPKGGSVYQTADALVNATRQRAGLSPLTGVSMQQLQKEKQKELCFEPARYFDMIRWNIGGAKIFPFPQDEIDRNHGSLVQNP
ncbi:RagB/SusD family nutrient uptake outer membrane protein [Segetibacter koreensis]|uniref:RagB/SusD family nutrient uptake outer membrane protein n=1 Tax=Segetibacter koreensis TaxID=398037 RepID=UPI00035DF663|nr:RagB/SusD family nutrient uptake outer membrane protein [Segetibacter koreensis]